MSVTATAVDPNCALVGGNTSPFTLFTANTVTGVVASAVLSAAMTSWLTAKLQKLIAVAGSGPVTAGASGYLASLFTLGDVTLTAPAIAYNQVGNVCSVDVTPNASPYVMVFALQFSMSPTAQLDQVSGAGGGTTPPLASNGVSGLVSGTGAPQSFGPGPFRFPAGLSIGDSIGGTGGTLSSFGELEVAQYPGYGIDAPSTDSTGTPGDVANVDTIRGRATIPAGQDHVTFTGMTAWGATSQCIPVLESDDATAKSLIVTGVPNSGGTFTVKSNANATADCNFSWFIFGLIQ